MRYHFIYRWAGNSENCLRIFRLKSTRLSVSPGFIYSFTNLRNPSLIPERLTIEIFIHGNLKVENLGSISKFKIQGCNAFDLEIPFLYDLVKNVLQFIGGLYNHKLSLKCQFFKLRMQLKMQFEQNFRRPYISVSYIDCGTYVSPV